jgi:TetR/AcrR family fatty acid metabolism transcriptional regulator
MTPKPDTIQEQLTAARRSQILNAATKIFAQKGFHRATIKEIAREAGLADGTIYLYFENKNALMLTLLHEINESEVRDLHFGESEGMEIGEFIKMYVRHRAEELRNEHPDLFRVVLSELLINEELREQYFQQVTAPTMELGVRYFKQWMEQGLIQKRDPYLTASAMAALFLGMFLLQELGDEELARRTDEIPDFLSDFVMNGLRKEPPHDHPNAEPS